MIRAILIGVLLAGCVPVVDPVAPTPPRPKEAEACAAFCELLTALECEGREGSPGEDELMGTADDVPCAQTCRDFMEGETFAPDRECLDTAATCEGAGVCVFGEVGA